MGEFCKECFKRIINPNAKDNSLIMSDTIELCEGCSSMKPVVIGEGCVDKLGGWHIDGIGYNPLGQFCGECNKMTCEGCVNAFVMHNYVSCGECILREDCENKERLDGCYFGEKDWYKYWHIRPNDDGCVVMAYNSQTKTLYQQEKGRDTNDTLIFPSEEVAKRYIQYSTKILNRQQFIPEPFLTTDKIAVFSKII